MRLTEELFIWVPIFVLGAYQWVCLRRKIIQNQWISIYSINLAKEWHKLNKAQVVHLRSQARHDVLRVLQKEGVSSFSLQPFDDLGHELTVSCHFDSFSQTGRMDSPWRIQWKNGCNRHGHHGCAFW